MNQPIVTAQLHLSSALRDPNDAEVAAAGALLARLLEEAAVLGETPLAAPVHHAMGRIWIERLGDPRSAASCFQASFGLDPKYRPNLEAARRLFATEGQWERALAIHEKEEKLLGEGAARAESMLAQARILSRELKRFDKADEKIQKALLIAPEHPALLRAAVEAAEKGGDKLGCARLLMRSAGAIKDDVQRGLMLRKAVLILEELHLAEMSAPRKAPAADQPFATPNAAAPTVTELEQLHEEALRRLAGAVPGDSIPALVMAQRARASGSWDELVQLAHEDAERSGAPADRLLAAQIAAFKQNRAQEALSELRLGLKALPNDSSLRALELELVANFAAAELAAALAATLGSANGPTEKADFLVYASLHAATPLERESMLSEALAENPGDAAAIAMHSRVVAERDAHAAAERYVALAEALESHAPHEAADQYAEAGLWLERSGARETAVTLARRALALQSDHEPSVRLLVRELPLLGETIGLAALLEDWSNEAPAWRAIELLSRAAALLSDLPAIGEVVRDEDGSETQIAEVPPMRRALELASRAAALAKGLTVPRATETLTLLALRAGDGNALGRVLEMRAAGADPVEAAELLIEAAELARVTGDDTRALSLLQRARASDPNSRAARRAILHMPALSLAERIEAISAEAAAEEPARATGMQAERAALLEAAGRHAEAVQACGLALSSGGVDLAVLRRLARMQLKLGDLPAALAVLEQIAQEAPEGAERAAAFGRAAEVAEWRLGDPARAEELYRKALESEPKAAFALAARARLLHWSGKAKEAAAAYEALAAASSLRGQKLQALRVASSLRAYRTRESDRAAELLRQILAEEPGDLDSMATLLSIGDTGSSSDARRERAELRGKLASRCQDPRLAALLRADSAEDRFAAGERDQGVAELRRALALNPQDRVALDLVEDSLRASQNRGLLIDHLSFRCACEEGATRAALAMEQAELLIEEKRLENAAAAYRLALQSDPGSLLAVRGARELARVMGDKPELMRLLTKEAALSPDTKLVAKLLIEAAALAEEMGQHEEAQQSLTYVLERDPRNSEVAALFRKLEGEEGARALAGLYERLGADFPDAQTGAYAWVQAGRIQLDELNDAQSGFIFAGRALTRANEFLPALLLRADSGESISRFAEVAEALSKCIALAPTAPPHDPPILVQDLQLRLGRLYLHALGDAKKALPLLVAHLQDLDVNTLLSLAPHAGLLAPVQAVPLYRRLLEIFPAPAESGSPTHAELLAWIDALAQGCLALGDRPAVLAACRIAVKFDATSKSAWTRLAQLASETEPDEAIAAWNTLLVLDPTADALHALLKLFQRKDQKDLTFIAASLLVGLGEASAEEKALHEAWAKLPPAAELPSLADVKLQASDDTGPVRALLAAASVELTRAFPTQITGRAERVKGDNPVRRVCTALARSLGLAGEPALYLSKSEPGLVAPAALESAGLIVGAEAPRRYPPRVQRFLYSRALAHLKYGTGALVDQSSSGRVIRIAALTAALVRLVSPEGTDLSTLPARDEAIENVLGPALSTEARARLGPLAKELLDHPFLTEAAESDLALALRESAERLAIILCGDPSAAFSIVAQECPGGLARPELARLARFTLSPNYLSLRAR